MQKQEAFQIPKPQLTFPHAEYGLLIQPSLQKSTNKQSKRCFDRKLLTKWQKNRRLAKTRSLNSLGSSQVEMDYDLRLNRFRKPSVQRIKNEEVLPSVKEQYKPTLRQQQQGKMLGRPQSSTDDPEIRQFNLKIREQRQILQGQRSGNSNSRNQEYYNGTQMKRIKILVTRQVAKIKRQLSESDATKALSSRSRKLSVLRKPRSKSKYREQLYKKFEEYLKKKRGLKQQQSISHCAGSVDRNGYQERAACNVIPSVHKPKKVRSLGDINEPVFRFKLKANQLVKPKSPIPIPDQPAPQRIKREYERVGLKQIDFRSQFQKFNTNMARTQRTMDDYLRNSLFLVQIETDLRYRQRAQQRNQTPSSNYESNSLICTRTNNYG